MTKAKVKVKEKTITGKKAFANQAPAMPMSQIPRQKKYPNLQVPFGAVENDTRQSLGGRSGGRTSARSFKIHCSKLLDGTVEEFYSKNGFKIPEHLEGYKKSTLYEAFVHTILHEAISCTGRNRAQLVPIAKLILERLEGQATQKIEVSGGVQHSLKYYKHEIDKLNADQIKTLIDARKEPTALYSDVTDIEATPTE